MCYVISQWNGSCGGITYMYMYYTLQCDVVYVVGLSQNYIIRSCKRCSYGYEEVDFLTHGSI